MPASPDIPLELIALWNTTRLHRAVLRQRLRERVEEFWKMFPRRRRRVMPVVVYGREGTWFEPEPVPGMEPPDRLGMVLRWRVSGVYATKEGDGTSSLHAMWEYEYQRTTDPPSASQLRAGHISDPIDIENYHFMWRQINALYEEYTWMSGWFASTIRQANHLSERLLRHPDGDELRRRIEARVQAESLAGQR